jgi:hypothetical protein
MFHILQDPINRNNDDIEGFGARYDNTTVDVNYPGIEAGQSRVVMFKLLSGIFNQEKFLPIRYMPITIELELTSILTDPIIYPTDLAGGVFTAAVCSTLWQIEDVQIKCDICSLDNALDNEYAQHLLSGKSLPINYNTYVSQTQQLVGQNPVINVTRALTRLKSIFINMDKTRGYENVQANGGTTYKTFNDFFHSMGALALNAQVYDPNLEMEFQVQIGSKLFPEYPMRSVAECFYQLRKTLGIHTSSFHNVDLTPTTYRTRKFILAIDTEKVLSAGFTGLNTKAGDLLSVKVKHASNVADNWADKMQIILHADMIVNIRDTGVEVLE